MEAKNGCGEWKGQKIYSKGLTHLRSIEDKQEGIGMQETAWPEPDNPSHIGQYRVDSLVSRKFCRGTAKSRLEFSAVRVAIPRVAKVRRSLVFFIISCSHPLRVIVLRRVKLQLAVHPINQHDIRSDTCCLGSLLESAHTYVGIRL